METGCESGLFLFRHPERQPMATQRFSSPSGSDSTWVVGATRSSTVDRTAQARHVEPTTATFSMKRNCQTRGIVMLCLLLAPESVAAPLNWHAERQADWAELELPKSGKPDSPCWLQIRLESTSRTFWTSGPAHPTASSKTGAEWPSATSTGTDDRTFFCAD